MRSQIEMRCFAVWLSAITAGLLAPANVAEGQVSDLLPANAGVRDTIQRALPFIEKKGAAWIENRKCISCHQVPSMMWSLNTADHYGFEVEQDELAKHNAWIADWIHFTNPKDRDRAKKERTLLNENDAIAGLLLGQANRATHDDRPEWIRDYLSGLINSQQADGSWKPRGQLPNQNRSLRETTEVSTMWALLAVDSLDGHSAHADVFAAARTWLGDDAVAESTEWWAARLLLEHQLDHHHRADDMKTLLLQYQNEDGGWGWLRDKESDAFGTGIAIYALCKSGVDTRHPAILKAAAFLRATQADNGSWTVNGTEENTRTHPTPTASYWGTCWAVIGLAETLSQTERPFPEVDRKRWH